MVRYLTTLLQIYCRAWR